MGNKNFVSALDDIVEKVDNAVSAEEAKEWKEDFVTAVNDAVNQEMRKDKVAGAGAGASADADALSVATGVTKQSRMSRLSRMDEDKGSQWDASTVVGKENKNANANVNDAAELLAERPHLKQMHSVRSMKTILEKAESQHNNNNNA